MFLQVLGTVIFSWQIFLSHQQDCIVPLPANWTLPTVNLSELYNLSSNPNDVVFYLYPNPANLSDYDAVTFDGTQSNVRNTRYDASKASIFLIHGFTGNFTVAGNPQTIKDAYLQNNFGPTNNIFAVDWGKLATPLPNTGVTLPIIPTNELNIALILLGYTLVYCNVPIVGNRTADFINFLNEQGLLTQGLSSVHIVGQSLGSHVAGFAGKRIINTNANQKIGRISGTEPAGPIYQETGIVLPSERLSSQDATFVDVYHTNQGQMGYFGNVGQVDFYINGGTVQPSCFSLNLTNAVANAFCSHNEAPFYYAQSIARTPKLTAYQCIISAATCVPIQLCSIFPYPPFCYTQTFGEYCPAGATGSYAINLNYTSN